MATGFFYPPAEFSSRTPALVTDSMTAKEVCENVTTDMFFTWNKYAVPTYAPVNKNGNWTFRIYLASGNSANYIIFEAFCLNDGEYYFYSYNKDKWYKATTEAV